MNSKDNFSTRASRRHRSFLSFHPPSASVTRISVLPHLCLDRLHSRPPPSPPPRKFHSKRTPLCKYSQESLLMLSRGGSECAGHPCWWMVVRVICRAMSRNRRNVLAECARYTIKPYKRRICIFNRHRSVHRWLREQEVRVLRRVRKRQRRRGQMRLPFELRDYCKSTNECTIHIRRYIIFAIRDLYFRCCKYIMRNFVKSNASYFLRRAWISVRDN